MSKKAASGTMLFALLLGVIGTLILNVVSPGTLSGFINGTGGGTTSHIGTSPIVTATAPPPAPPRPAAVKSYRKPVATPELARSPAPV